MVKYYYVIILPSCKIFVNAERNKLLPHYNYIESYVKIL